MAILSKRTIGEVSRAYQAEHGLQPCFLNLVGGIISGTDPLAVLSNTKRRRDYALQQSINLGAPHVFRPAPGIVTWIVGLENRRIVHGTLLGGEVREEAAPPADETVSYLEAHGMEPAAALDFLNGCPTWPASRIEAAGLFLQETFYQVSGWQPELMKESRLRIMQQEQIAQSIEDQRKRGVPALYAFEKERILLANIRAGDRNEARRLLNEMLATIFMSSPKLVVLRARTIELMSYLTRAAIEDNPLMEPLIERNHRWTERLVTAGSFEDLSEVLMSALDDFIDGIYLHGINRSNAKVSRALDYISENYMKKISLREVSREVGLSSCRLAHLVREFTGRTVLQIIQQVRIRQAQHLLERTSKSCTEIAYDVGFGDQSYFIKHFRKVTGKTPVRYRRMRRG